TPPLPEWEGWSKLHPYWLILLLRVEHDVAAGRQLFEVRGDPLRHPLAGALPLDAGQRLAIAGEIDPLVAVLDVADPPVDVVGVRRAVVRRAAQAQRVLDEPGLRADLVHAHPVIVAGQRRLRAERQSYRPRGHQCLHVPPPDNQDLPTVTGFYHR